MTTVKHVTRVLFLGLWAISTAVIGCDDNKGDDSEIEDAAVDGNENREMNVADTGQTECASGVEGTEAMVSCADESVSVAGQDGSYVDLPNARSFSGPTAHGTFTGDATTSDNVSGLVWRACSEGLELSDTACEGTVAGMTWQQANEACEALNSLNNGAGYAGIAAWRLPTIKELRTLVNYGGTNPTIDAQYFPDTSSNWYWSVSEHRNKRNAFTINFESGNVLWWTKQDLAFVRCVSGDTESGGVEPLVWTRCSMKTVSETPEMDTTADCSDTNGVGSWKDALAACENLEHDGRSDWRLPSAAELHSLIDVTQTEGVFLDLQAFPDTPGAEAYYWSSTTYSGLGNGPCLDVTTCAWYVNFNDGYVEGVKIRSQKDQENYVRCVAGP